MHETNFGGRGCSSFGDIACFCLPSKRPNFPLGPWTIVHGGQKIELIDWNRTKIFMQIRIDELCMCTNFGGCDLFGFGDTATFKKRPNFPFGPWTIVHGHQKI